jgi:uncharacterized phiE125 gp8 family phage protein
LAAGASWPHTDDTAAAVTVNYTAGYYGGEVPQTLVLAVKMFAGHWFEQREAATDRRFDSVPFAVESILTQQTYPEAV